MEFREALRELHVRVNRETLLLVARYFQAPTSKRQSTHHQQTSQCRGLSGGDVDIVEISYVTLVDFVFGRKGITPGSRERAEHTTVTLSKDDRDVDVTGESKTEEHNDCGKGICTLCSMGKLDDVQRQKWSNDEVKELATDDHRYYVDVDQIRAARVAVLDIRDALGRVALFIASAAGAVSAAKILLRHGATPTFAVEGTQLNALTVAPNSQMRQIITMAARRSLVHVASARRKPADNSLSPAATAAIPGPDDNRASDQHPMLVADRGVPRRDEPRMESLVAIIAEAERDAPSEGEVRADMKTSLHFAASAGLPGAVRAILGIAGDNGAKSGDAARSQRPPWTSLSSRPLSSQNSAKARALGSDDASSGANLRGFVHHGNFKEFLQRKSDASGWSALHGCCAGFSPGHYRCALALLESRADPNAMTNTGRTPLHVAASVACAGGISDGVSR